jgi:hypothetical protein
MGGVRCSVGVLTRGGSGTGELIAIRGTEKRNKKLFSAIHFPFRFPRPYRSPYLSDWEPPTRFNPAEDPTVHKMWREVCAAVSEQLGDLGLQGYSRRAKVHWHSALSAPLSTITLLISRFPHSSTPTRVGFAKPIVAYLLPPSLTPPPLA